MAIPILGQIYVIVLLDLRDVSLTVSEVTRINLTKVSNDRLQV
jgi:hypothetical protein